MYDLARILSLSKRKAQIVEVKNTGSEVKVVSRFFPVRLLFVAVGLIIYQLSLYRKSTELSLSGSKALDER